MKSKHPKKELNELIDNELNQEEKSKFLKHLKECPKCNKEYKTLLFLKNMLYLKEKAEPSEYFIPRVLNNLAAAESSISLIDLIARRAWSLILAFSCVIIIALGIFIYSDFKAPAESNYSEGYENLILAENGAAVTESVSIVEVSYADVWQSLIEE